MDSATSPAPQLPIASEVVLPCPQFTKPVEPDYVPDPQQTKSHPVRHRNPEHVKPHNFDQQKFTSHPANYTRPERSKQPSTTLIIGSSITKYINAERLTRGSGKKCINLSKSGAKVKDCAVMIDDFVQCNKVDTMNIERVVFSIGTNDIKLFKQDTNKFWTPLKELVFKVRQCFGYHVSIVFQSVIPMKCMYTYTPSNFFGFNQVLMRLCHRFNCEYIDCFNDFLDCDGRDINKFLYRDHLHLNVGGLEILCKYLKNAIIPNFRMNTDFCYF